MKDLFLKRKQEFRKECLGYLRYVLNDHFVLFLLVLLGFLAYQYNQLLQHFPENHFPILILIGMISILLLLWGGIATYLEAPDKLFLLVAEEEVREHIQKQSLISFIFWVSVQTLFFAPVCAFILSHGSWFADFLGVYLLVLGIAKYVFFAKSLATFSLEMDFDMGLCYCPGKQTEAVLASIFCSLYPGQGISNSVNAPSFIWTLS